MTSLFEALCLKEFEYLKIEYGFKTIAIESNRYGTYGKRVVFQNNTTGIIVAFEVLDGGVFVDLARLVNNQIVGNPILIRSDSLLHMFELNLLLELRSPTSVVIQDLEKLLNPSSSEMERVIRSYAIQLRHWASDILQGNFRVFDELERMVKQHAQDYGAPN